VILQTRVKNFNILPYLVILLLHVKGPYMEFKLVIIFIGILWTVTTINYSSMANSCTLQFTTAWIKSLVPSLCSARSRPEQLRVAEAAAVPVCCYKNHRDGLSGLVWLEENTLSTAVLGTLCDFLFSALPLCACINNWRDQVPLHQPTCSCSMLVLKLYCHFPGINCAGDHPHTICHKEVAVQLAQTWQNCWLSAVTLRGTNLGFVNLYSDCNMAKAHQFEHLMGLWHTR
jgi:hypothetical protein